MTAVRPTSLRYASLVKKWASELANHAMFGAARTGDQREFLLESIAGGEIDTLPTGDILSRADSLYQFEIKPRKMSVCA